MDLSERIIKYIENHNPISYTTIVQVAAGKGFNEIEVLQALEKVASNKSITTKTRKNEIWYYFELPTEKPKPTYTLPPYPHTELGESPFKVCSCAQWHVHWENKMGHFPSCDAHHPDYSVQNPWDYTAGTMIDLKLYEKVVQQEKAIRSRRTKGYHAISPR